MNPVPLHQAAEPDASHGDRTGAAPDWDEIHATVQAILAELRPVLPAGELPPRSQGGRTTARAFFLCSFWTFSATPTQDREAVVAGVTFVPSANGVLVRADVCGEDTGQIFWEMTPQEIPGTRLAVLHAAEQAALQLRSRGDVVGHALTETA